MNILFLGPDGQAQSRIVDFLRCNGHRVVVGNSAIDNLDISGFCYLVCYGYRCILSQKFLDRFGDAAINLHISFLPWNRGADPNLWSILEDTQPGVSIHTMIDKLDRGPILAQRAITHSTNDTLRSSYRTLTENMEELFVDNWDKIQSGEIEKREQVGEGSSHKIADKDKYSSVLVDGWDTPIKDLIGLGRKNAYR